MIKPKDLTGQKYGKLTFLRPDIEKHGKWICKCDCGNEKSFYTSNIKRGLTTSCGCIISRGEESIRKFLNNWNVNFDTQYCFCDLKSKKGWALRFDFAILDNNGKLLCLVEYQGQQHYDESYGWFRYQQRHETDILKEKYCNINNIPFYEISFKDDIETKLKNILSNFKIYKSIPCQAS